MATQQHLTDDSRPVENENKTDVQGTHPTPHAFTRLLTRWPITVACTIFAVSVGLVIGVGLPQFQQGFEGYDARNSRASRVADGFSSAVDSARDYMSAGKDTDEVTGVTHEPLTQELAAYRTIFFFYSASGDIFSEANLKSAMNVLNAVNGVLSTDYCYKGVGDGESCAPPWTLMDVFKTDESAKLKDMMKKRDSVPGLAPMLKLFVGSEADFDKGTASWMQGHIRMGGPLPGYHNMSHDEGKQLKVYDAEFQVKGFLGPEPSKGGWVEQFDAIISREEKANADFKVYYGGKLFFPRIFGFVNIDIQYAVISLFLVAIFMWVQLGSVFLTCAGMFSVVMSFVLTLPTWKLLGNETFTFMQAMVVYIILGIGADNVFVFSDAWKQSRAQPRSVSGSLEMRFQWSWSRAMNAMSVTSLTTGCAFVLTSLADVPVISTFGTFAAMVVAWGYLLVITWFPACIVIHEKYVVQRKQGFMAARCCGCLFPICGNQWGLGTGEDVEVSSGKDDSGSNVDKLRGPERFFHSTWYSVLKRRPVRLGIIAVFTGMATVGIVLAGTKVQVTKRPTTESILKKSHPLQKTFDLLRGVDPAFKAADSAQKEVGYWAYGLDFKDPVDRTGTDPLGNGVNGDEITFSARSGVARYAGSDLTSEAFQAKVVEDCSKIENLTSVYRPTTGGRGEIYCFMHDFKTYLESNRRTFPVASHTLVDELLAWQRNKSCTGVGCYKNRLGTGVTQGRENGGLYEKGTGFSADGKTIKFMYIGANMSIPRTNLDLAIIVPEYEEWRDSALKENREDVALGVEAIGLTGRALWIATMDALVSGVITAVPTSVGLSFVVLTVTTGNWQVAAIATITIVGVMGCFFLTFVAQAQTLGVYESMFLSLTAGFAVDYVVHLAHAYNEADASDRCDKMQHSLTAMGVSVVSGAISTLMASMMLFICSFNFFSTYGSFIFFVIFWSLVWAMLFFPAAMMTIGPNGGSGDILVLRKLQGHTQRSSRDRESSEMAIELGLKESPGGGMRGNGGREEEGVSPVGRVGHVGAMYEVAHRDV